MKKFFYFFVLFFGIKSYSQFTSGNLVIYRVGDGSAALTSSATAVFLDEYTPSGTLVQSIALPTTVSGSNKRITASGTATSEGLITRSIDGQYILAPGYDAALGTASITTSSGTTINRVVGRIDASGNIDATTGLTDFSSGGNPRSVVSTNGTDLWIDGSAGGIRYTTLGSTTSTQLSTTVTNLRQTNIFSSQLYITTSSGTTVRLGTVGTGTPTTSGQTITSLPGFPISTGSPYAFFFAPNLGGVGDVLYVADDGSSTGFQKYSLVSGSWVANGNVSVTGNALRGLVATVSGTTVTLYGTNGTSLVTLVDASGYNATISGTVTTLATAPTNTAFRGLAFTPASASPSLSATTLNSFGNICINTTAGPNSFTINGTNLTNVNVNVGPLTGYTFSTTSGGMYSSSLSLPQPGGTYTQDVYVKFIPTLVQSYNGNIPVSGGGASSINVAVSGAGINTMPSVTTGSASNITTTSADLAGTITANGCSSVTVYGIEYSTTSGFTNGTGTQVPSTNLSGGNFSSNVTGLSPGTTYYYKAYATNNGGTAYGSEQSFTTNAAIPSLTATTLNAFGNVCINTTAGPNSFTINGIYLTNANVDVGPLSGFTFSTTSGGTYSSSLSLSQPGGTFTQDIYVQFTPTLVQSYNGNIPVSGGGASAINVAASGAGVNTTASATTGGASNITTTSADLAGTISDTGCSSVTAYGIEYSTTSGFTNGTGTQVPSSNLSGGNFSSNITGLSPNTTYYYKAYATNNGGTAYGNEQSFTTLALTPTLIVTPLNPFGNVCINTTVGPNSFTINGSALTNANITVGPLSGFIFSTTSGGTYSSSLNLSQPGGTYTQDIYVQFSPTLVQSYNGNIPVGGGGAAAINVAASGAGVDDAPSVTTGVASNITSISADAAGTITSTGCSSVSSYGIEYSTVNGFSNGTGTQVPSSNLSGGNFSSNLTGLSPSTIYYYKAYATNNGGTTWGIQQTFTTATPGLSATPLTAFGNVCINATAGPNSFTITGTNLTTANVDVGPLSGYTFSITSGGSYTNSLSLSQIGGSYSQTIYVKFTPTAVQSYNGNIPMNGGGASAINVAASGAGINTAPSVTTGTASSITYNSATATGTITATGCSSVTVYGIEYSTTNGFTNGTGTQVTSSNLSGGNFSSNLTSLTASTIYYYKAYATNNGGTTWGSQQSFTTAPLPVALTVTTLNAFGNVCINTAAGPNSFTINGVFLNNTNINVGPLNGYSFSTTSGGTYSSSLSLSQPGGTYSQTIYVKFTPTAVQSYNGNIPVSGGGAALITVAASGSGINTTATVVTGSSSNTTNHSTILAGSISDIGCSNVTAYGIEYSGINGFANGNGTKMNASNLNGNNFSVSLDGLVQGATYYYKAFATNNGGIMYGSQQSFTVLSITNGFTMNPNPVARGNNIRVTMNDLTPGYYGLLFINSQGQVAYQRNINIQVNFINQEFEVPAALSRGVYRVQLVNESKAIATKTILIL